MSERIVVFTARNLLDQGRRIVLDNWYMSVRLAQFLLEHDTTVTGTIRANRGVPPELLQMPLQKQQSAFLRKGNMLLVRYKDKKCVCVLTTKYTAGYVDKTRYVHGGKQQHFKKPAQVERYNTLMGSVDLCDQDIEPYDCCR